MTYWILIADASRARLFSTTARNKPLKLEREIDNPTGRLREQELVTDEPGRYSKGGKGGMKSAMGPDTSAHENEAQRFARQLAQLAHQVLSHNPHDNLGIVAPAHFLGLLRQALPPHDANRLLTSIPRDLTQVSAHDLPSHLAEVFPPGTFME